MFLAASLAIGLAISVGVLAIAGISPATLAGELAGMLDADSLRAVLVQAAPLVLVGLGASLAFRIGFWNLGLEGQMIFGGIAATGVSIYAIGPRADADRPHGARRRSRRSVSGCCSPWGSSCAFA